jgi:hypothetical protein
MRFVEDYTRIGWVTQRMLVKSGLEVRLLLCKSLQNLCGILDGRSVSAL